MVISLDMTLYFVGIADMPLQSSGDTADQTPVDSHTSSIKNSSSEVAQPAGIAATSVNSVRGVAVSRTVTKSDIRYLTVILIVVLCHVQSTIIAHTVVGF